MTTILAALRHAANSLETAAETFEQLGQPATAALMYQRAAEARAVLTRATT